MFGHKRNSQKPSATGTPKAGSLLRILSSLQQSRDVVVLILQMLCGLLRKTDVAGRLHA
jgi:hypothetical protein